jgi:putative membrane protein
MPIAFAHEGHDHSPVLPTSSPSSAFELKWAIDPSLAFFFLMAVLYIRGLRSYKGRSPVTTKQKVFFFLGIAILFTASLPPVDSWADQLFSAHMVQHLLITMLGVPLIVMGAPFYVVIHGLSNSFRSGIVVRVLQTRFFRKTQAWLARPFVAAIIYEATMWFWHTPPFYNKALLNDAIHLLEHACMALAALNLWRLLLDAPPARTLVSYPLRILIIGLLITLDSALSAALTFSSRPWYAYQLLPQPSWWSGNLLEDQRLGGLLMWVPGGVAWIAALVANFVSWTKKDAVYSDKFLAAKKLNNIEVN